ncbi:hypothetical protein [Brevibacillus choshinensis]|uniref:Spore coat protein n=1 Tax=Brevibacillus choshinensis TaxID=54911 RepID=A0ABX7FII1_BRECH|nr:hypothetical protein [Brevibacillus choshinensis]QRG65670.1 hypothetical protein JNE38_18935 [Brevibacillus choshinensis]
MNVIGIIQTDLNEFSVLFDQPQGGGQGGGNQQQSQGQGQGQQQQDNQDSDSMFLSFLDEQPSSQEGNHGGGGGNGGGGGGGQQQQQNGPQEMTVRIKGIPEGQKANFLQMYQILQDAQDSQSLSQSLTIVNQGDQQDGQGQGQGQRQRQGGSGQDQSHGSGKQNKATH